jgi:ATP-dependent DNA ligase
MRTPPPLVPPIKPMLAKAVASIPADAIYEPKWDGFRSICFRDGDDIVLGSRNERPLTRYFPELVEAARVELPDRCVIDGEIVVPTASGLDFEALQQRIHPADSRVQMLAVKTSASFIAFDLLAVGDENLMDQPFDRRRARLERVLRGAGTRFHLTPATTDMATARRWFSEFEGAGLDGIIAKPAALGYLPDKRVMFKVKHQRTADCVVAGYRPHKSGADAVGSLLLGLYQDDGALASVGVIGAFPMATRRRLITELAPLVTDFDQHPWNWAAQVAADPELARRYGGGSRWAAGKDLSFVPLRPERVVEVRYDYMEGQRFRHTAQFSRWRPDREPASCTFAQLEQPAGIDLQRIIPGLV